MQKNYCTIYLVRHGKTEWNEKRLIQGHTDIPLNRKGELEIKSLIKELKGIKFDKAYASDLLRARKTAELIAIEHKLEIEVSKDLRERNYAHLEGKDKSELKEIDEKIALLSKKEQFIYKHHPKIESIKEVMDRFLNHLKQIANKNKNKTILVVTHGGPMWMFLAVLKKIDTNIKYIGIKNLAYMVLEFNGKNFEIKKTSGISY